MQQRTNASPLIHPSVALVDAEPALPSIPPCEHIAGNEKMIRKALQLQQEMAGAFDLTADCEDGAVVGHEREHAAMVARLLSEAPPARVVLGAGSAAARVGVRIHDIDSPHWREDVATLIGEAGDRIAYMTLPKVRGASDAARMQDWIVRRTAVAGLARVPALHVLVETHGALQDIQRIAALPGLETLDFGLLDFVSAHQGALGADAMRSPMQFEHPLLVRAKTEIVAAALAHGVVPAHNVSRALRDEAATFADAKRAREQFGFLRMWSIHPAQIAPIVAAMQPGLEEVGEAARILLAAQRVGWGPIGEGGDLHDRASYRQCWSVLQRAVAARMPVPEEARAAFFD
jgi:citrate lyase subunit beta / citryl-CoA lyase